MDHYSEALGWPFSEALAPRDGQDQLEGASSLQLV